MFNTLNQLMAMRRGADPALEITDTVFFMPDLFHYYLTGKKASEFTLASISQSYNVDDAWNGRYADASTFPDPVSADRHRVALSGRCSPHIAGNRRVGAGDSARDT